MIPLPLRDSPCKESKRNRPGAYLHTSNDNTQGDLFQEVWTRRRRSSSQRIGAAPAMNGTSFALRQVEKPLRVEGENVGLVRIADLGRFDLVERRAMLVTRRVRIKKTAENQTM